MKVKRVCAILLLLGGLVVLAVIGRRLPSSEPAYQGKTVSVWFKQYAFATNSAVRTSVLSFSPSGRALIIQNTSTGGTIIPLQLSTNRPNWIAEFRSSYESPADPAWLALQALGSNA